MTYRNSTAASGHTQRQWEGKFFRCQMQCWYCRIPLLLRDDGTGQPVATKDHLVPTSRGGSSAIANIVPACIDCNQLKGDLTDCEFREERKQFSAQARTFTSSHLRAPLSPVGSDENVQNNDGGGNFSSVRLDPQLTANMRLEARLHAEDNPRYAAILNDYCDQAEELPPSGPDENCRMCNGTSWKLVASSAPDTVAQRCECSEVRTSRKVLAQSHDTDDALYRQIVRERNTRVVARATLTPRTSTPQRLFPAAASIDILLAASGEPGSAAMLAERVRDSTVVWIAETLMHQARRGMKPLAIDLYCGMGGWAEGFLSEGYRAGRVDIRRTTTELAAIGRVSVARALDSWLRISGRSRRSAEYSVRKAASAMIAKIPFPLAQHIAQSFKPVVNL